MALIDSPVTPFALPATPGADVAAAAADGAAPDRMRVAAEKFEAHFITETLRQMRRSTRELGGDDAVFKDRVGDDMLDMADTMLADALAGRHAFGIADVILRQLAPAPLNPTATPVALDIETKRETPAHP